MKKEQQKPHWLPCPICKKKTDVKIHEDTTLLYFPLQCPHCKQETLIHVVQLKMVEQQRLKVNPPPLHCFPQYRTKAHHLW